MKTKRNLQKQLAKLTYDPEWVNIPEIVKRVRETRMELEKLSGFSRKLKQYDLIDPDGNIEGSYTAVELSEMLGVKVKIIRNAISEKRTLTERYGKFEGYRIEKTVPVDEEVKKVENRV